MHQDQPHDRPPRQLPTQPRRQALSLEHTPAQWTCPPIDTQMVATRSPLQNVLSALLRVVVSDVEE